MMAGLLDTQNALMLIDSNVDPPGGRVHRLEMQAKADDTILLKRTKYDSWEQYIEKAPPWISIKRAEQLKRSVLEVEWKRDLLGRRSDAVNGLFPAEVIELCKSKYQIPATDIQFLSQGRAFKVGGGLDRSKSLFGGDNTVWSVVLKVASPEHGEPEYFTLSQELIVPNTSRMIKRAILKDHEKYKLDMVTMENYEVTDLAPWLSDQRIPFELVSAHDTNQNASFPEFHRICKEGRFHFPESLKGLASEMGTFVYTQKTGGTYSFGHASQKFKDDRVYSVNWAIFSLRDAVMNLYTLGSFACKNKSTRRHLCFLMGGSLRLLCRESCHAYQEVEGMFRQYKQYRLDSEITVEEFFDSKVKHVGARISQAA
jgi:hypothetical protein